MVQLLTAFSLNNFSYLKTFKLIKRKVMFPVTLQYVYFDFYRIDTGTFEA